MAPFRVAIVHYHLRTGGVTRVIQHAVSSLTGEEAQCVVLTGEQPPDPENWPHARILPDLAYGAELGKREASDVIDDMTRLAQDVLGGPPDIWHIHNHALGKNLVLPAVTMELAKRGERLALQIHDFAEDGRPKNYHYLARGFACEDAEHLGATIYPQGEHVFYVPLNARDASFLRLAGVPSEQVHLLHNPASIKGQEKTTVDDVAGPRLYLYPTRAIRRKNIGEFLLWSALDSEGSRYGLTLAPENPTERRIYDPWVSFAADRRLPVDFEMGAAEGVSFSDLIARSHAIVSTSIAEGFGLAFLEPWVMGKPLLGRNLGDITSEFAGLGVNLNSLYEDLRIPLDWVDEEGLKARLQRSLTGYYEAYGRPQPADAFERAWAMLSNGSSVEFSRLDEEEQRRAIEAACTDDVGRKDVRPHALEMSAMCEKMLQENHETVLREFSLQKYGERLVDMYTSLMNAHVGSLGEFSASSLLDQFLAPERFYLLRS